MKLKKIIMKYVNLVIPYGHIKEFLELDNNIKNDAHRVISPLALILSGIEEAYSVVDIYDLEIFEEGNYRITNIEKFKEISKEVAHERNPIKHKMEIIGN